MQPVPDEASQMDGIQPSVPYAGALPHLVEARIRNMELAEIYPSLSEGERLPDPDPSIVRVRMDGLCCANKRVLTPLSLKTQREAPLRVKGSLS